MKRHEWRDDGEGGMCQYRATHHAGRWEFHTLLESDEDWVLHDPIPVEYLRRLREVLFRKYQRRRVPFEQIEQIDQMIQEAQ